MGEEGGGNGRGAESGGCETNSIPCSVGAFGGSTTARSHPQGLDSRGRGRGEGEERRLGGGRGEEVVVLFLLLPASAEGNLMEVAELEKTLESLGSAASGGGAGRASSAGVGVGERAGCLWEARSPGR